MAVNQKIFTIKTDYGSFSCVFEKEKDVSTWGVHCEAIPGAFTIGSTLSEAKKMMKEALELHIEFKAEDNLVRAGRIKVLKKDGVIAHI